MPSAQQNRKAATDVAAFRNELKRLWEGAGRPSQRDMAARAGRPVTLLTFFFGNETDLAPWEHITVFLVGLGADAVQQAEPLRRRHQRLQRRLADDAARARADETVDVSLSGQIRANHVTPFGFGGLPGRDAADGVTRRNRNTSASATAALNKAVAAAAPQQFHSALNDLRLSASLSFAALEEISNRRLPHSSMQRMMQATKLSPKRETIKDFINACGITSAQDVRAWMEAYDRIREGHPAALEVPRAVAIHALGVFRVTRNGMAVPRTAWQSRKARDLLKILVSRSRPVPRDQLMELLWPDVDPGKSGNRLSVLLSTVRDVLQPVEGGPQPLTTDGTAVWLDPALVSIDVEEFRKVATRALEAHRSGHPDAVDRLCTAAALYTGDFLEDDPYAEWAQPVTEELRALHQAVLRALIDHRQSCGDTDEVVRHTLRLLEDDPYDEQAHLNLVTVLLTAGRIGEAHRRYQIYRRHMGEMGVEPRAMLSPAKTRPNDPGGKLL
jgi:DNA-binding SARP family transcriptional activator